MNTTVKLFITCLVFIQSILVIAQVERPYQEFKTDSLEKANAAHRKQDAAKVTLLNQLASKYASVNFDKGIETGTQAIALAEKLNNTLLLAEACHNTALNFNAKSEFEKAMELYDKALAINQNQNNKYGIAQNMMQIADIASLKADRKKTLESYEKSLSLFEEIQNPEGIAKAYNAIGNQYLSDPPKALALFEKALTLNAQLGNKSGLSRNYSGIGKVYLRLSDYPKALENFQKALSFGQQSENQRLISASHMNLGLAYKSISDFTNALESYQSALTISEKLGDKSILSAVLGNMGSSYSGLSDYPKALEFYQRALSMNEEMGYQQGIAANLALIGNLYAALFDYTKALEFHQKSLSIHEQLDNQDEIATSFLNIGMIHYHLSDYTKALDFYQKALGISEQTGNKRRIATLSAGKGGVYVKLFDYPKALESYQKALSIFEQIGDKGGIANSLGNIGNVYREAPNNVLHELGINPGNRFSTVLEFENRKLHIAKEIGALSQQKEALGNMSRTYELQKDYEKAFTYLKNYITIKDSIQGEETKKQITRKEMLYEFGKKETELKFQQQLTDEQLAKQQLINKQRLRIYLLGLIAFLGIIGLLVTRLRYARKKQQLLQRQKEIEQRESERLADLDILKTNLYTNITHEFRTPLTLILGPVRKMLNKPDAVSSTELEENLKLVEGNGQRLLALVNQILDLQKLEAHQLKPQYEQDNVMMVLQYLVDSFHSLVESKNISLKFEGQPDSLMMDYDRDKMQKICSNLIANAIKFTPDGGAVKVIASQQDDWLEIAVIDSGIGIPKENLDTIFSLFYQVDNTSTRTQEGTGIGLTLVKELVELHGGNIRVESEPGKGSAFYVRLPIRQDAPISESKHTATFEKAAHDHASPAMSTGALIADNNNAAPLILIVEDNADVARYLGTCLETEYRIEYAANGKKGIEQAVESIPDLVISDVMMPEADGFEVCRFLKEDARTSHIPVILLTALSEVKDRLEGLRRGADAYLTKPFFEEELLITVEKLLRLRQVLRKRYLGLIAPEHNMEIGETEVKDEIHVSAIRDKSFDLLMEDAFMSKVLAVIHEHLDDSEFSVELLNRAMGMSNTQLFRKLKVLTDLSGNQLIRQVRMSRAKELLRHSNLTIAEIAYQTGFTDPSYFTRIFSREAGVTPTEFSK